MSAAAIGRRALRAVRAAGFDYSCYRIMRFALEDAPRVVVVPDGLTFEAVGREAVAASQDAVIRECDWYGGDGAHGFAIRDTAGRILCLQWYWSGERYRRAAFWPLDADEAASMHLVTVQDARSRGLATLLKTLSADVMRDRGFRALYSRIWWTNASSLRVSEKAGWVRVGTTLRMRTPFRRKPFALDFGTRGS